MWPMQGHILQSHTIHAHLDTSSPLIGKFLWRPTSLPSDSTWTGESFGPPGLDLQIVGSGGTRIVPARNASAKRMSTNLGQPGSFPVFLPVLWAHLQPRIIARESEIPISPLESQTSELPTLPHHMSYDSFFFSLFLKNFMAGPCWVCGGPVVWNFE